MKKILVGMSGGVDSSAAAFLLKEQGYEVWGATLILRDGAEAEVQDAAAVCAQIGIPHIKPEFKREFERYVTAPFVAEYAAGRTPNPCIICNKKIKFGVMLDYALENGFDAIATGHYAVTDRNEKGEKRLLKSDSPKDQSYFLYMLDNRQLEHTVFPIAGMEKEKIRTIAEQNGLITARKKDSQEICFVPNDDYASYIENRGVHASAGNFVDRDGNVLGQHGGITRFTVGQRRGLGMGFGRPLYVTAIDAVSGNVYLGDDKDLYSHGLKAENVTFISKKKPPSTFEATVKIRYRAAPCPAQVTMTDDDKMTVVFERPLRAVTPGQSAVLYDGDVVLGGGIITYGF